jgi:hypothetical protein
MSALEKREKAMEEMYFLDSEMAFRVQSRRDRLLAQWVVALVGATDFEAYVAEIIDVRMTAAGNEGVVAKIPADVRSAGRVLGEKELRARMETLMADAAEAIVRRPDRSPTSQA